VDFDKMICIEKSHRSHKNRAAMIRTTSSKQLTIAEFDWPFETVLDKSNRWVRLADCISWDELAESYYQRCVQTESDNGVKSWLRLGNVANSSGWKSRLGNC